MNTTNDHRLALAALVCAVGAVLLLAAGPPKITATRIEPDVTINTIARDKNHSGFDDTWTEVIKRGAARVAIVTKSLSKSGVTNVTSLLLLGDIMVTVIDKPTLPQVIYIEDGATRKVEGFRRSMDGDFRPLPEAEIETFKQETRQWEKK